MNSTQMQDALETLPRGLIDLLRPLAVPPAEDEPYGRRVLATGERGEIMLAAWRAGGTCAAHDHGGAAGVVAILEGTFLEQLFVFERGALALLGERTHGPGDVVRVVASTIHRMSAPRGGLTLHLYAPAPAPMRVFDPRAACTWLLRDGGAWIPSRGALGVETWTAG